MKVDENMSPVKGKQKSYTDEQKDDSQDNTVLSDHNTGITK